MWDVSDVEVFKNVVLIRSKKFQSEDDVISQQLIENLENGSWKVLHSQINNTKKIKWSTKTIFGLNVFISDKH